MQDRPSPSSRTLRHSSYLSDLTFELPESVAAAFRHNDAQNHPFVEVDKDGPKDRRRESHNPRVDSLSTTHASPPLSSASDRHGCICCRWMHNFNRFLSRMLLIRSCFGTAPPLRTHQCSFESDVDRYDTDSIRVVQCRVKARSSGGNVSDKEVIVGHFDASSSCVTLRQWATVSRGGV
jgi:hypothetical protein